MRRLLICVLAGSATLVPAAMPAAQGAAKPSLTLKRGKAEIVRVLDRRYRQAAATGQYVSVTRCKRRTRTAVACAYTVFQKVDDAYSEAYYGGGDQPVGRGYATATLARGRVAVKVSRPAPAS